MTNVNINLNTMEQLLDLLESLDSPTVTINVPETEDYADYYLEQVLNEQVDDLVAVQMNDISIEEFASNVLNTADKLLEFGIEEESRVLSGASEDFLGGYLFASQLVDCVEMVVDRVREGDYVL